MPLPEYANDTECIEHRDTFSYNTLYLTDVRKRLVADLIKARREKGYSQARLAEITELSQPAIARIEGGITVPNMRTLLRLLAPLGKTIQIVDM